MVSSVGPAKSAGPGRQALASVGLEQGGYHLIQDDWVRWGPRHSSIGLGDQAVTGVGLDQSQLRAEKKAGQGSRALARVSPRC